MPQRDVILNLPGFTIKKAGGYNPLVLDVFYRRKARCIYCNTRKIRKKASFIRRVRHESIGHANTVLQFKAYKFYCSHCNRYFNQQFPGIGKYQRSTARLQAQIFYQHSEGISQKSLARDFKLGKSTVERWYHQYYLRECGELESYQCPEVLGIDEHFFTRKQGYVTTLCDLRKHRVFDIVKGRAPSELSDYFNQLRGKERVKVICMDLSSSYRHVARRHFPHAKIVADRFHVIRLVHHQCLQTYQEIDPTIKYQRGIIAALRTKPDNLNSKRLQKRDDYLNQKPVINAIYQFKQRLYTLLMKKTVKAKRCRRLIPILLNMIEHLKQSPFKRLVTLGKTLFQWKEEIVCMWRFTKNNGITEGFHRKMKLIQRRAYGFRNFENYRLRVKVLCS